MPKVIEDYSQYARFKDHPRPRMDSRHSRQKPFRRKW